MKYINQSRRSDQTPTRGLTLSKDEKNLVVFTKKLFAFDRVRPRKQKSEKVASTGDTIIEVMISLVILSMILAAVYAMGTRSLRAGTEANQRTEALTTAQSQVDLLINAKNIDPSFATDFQTDQAYCLRPDGSKDPSAQSNVNKLCNSYSGSQYNIGVSYSSNLFTVTAQWPSADAPGGTANLNLYYKLPGIYKKAFVNATTASVTGLNVTINGTVNPNSNIVTRCYFNYDTSTTYSHAQQVDCTALPGSGTTDVAVHANISGLDANTTYFFQLCATNLVGTACSANNGTFTTPARPSINNEAAHNTTSQSGNNADLVAQVNPNGTTVTACNFGWGTDTSYANTKICGGTIGQGTNPVSVTVNVAPLTPGVTYHFRVVATNAAGTTTGTDHTFVTSRTPAPTASLTADSGSSTIPYNTGTTLRWTSTDATSCTGNGFSTGRTSPTSGNTSTGNLISTTSYTVTCSGAGGSVTSSPARVTVAPPPPTINSFDAGIEPTIYTTKGVPRTLQWSTSNASRCTGSWAAGDGDVGLTSSDITAYNGTTTYTLTCYNSSGNSTPRSFTFTYVYSNACLYSDIDWGGWNYCYDQDTDPAWLAAHGSYAANSMLGQASSINVNSGIAAVRSGQGVCHDFDWNNLPPAKRFTDISSGSRTFNDNVSSITVGKNCAGR